MQKIFQLNKKVAKIHPSDTLYIMVHPFWPVSVSHEFLSKICGLIHDEDRPILTLEVPWLLNETISTYKKLSPKGPRYFMFTKANTGDPKNIDKFIYIIERFKPQKIILGGANLSGNENTGYTQCVGGFYNFFKPWAIRLNIKFIFNEELCWRIGSS